MDVKKLCNIILQNKDDISKKLNIKLNKIELTALSDVVYTMSPSMLVEVIDESSCRVLLSFVDKSKKGILEKRLWFSEYDNVFKLIDVIDCSWFLVSDVIFENDGDIVHGDEQHYMCIASDINGDIIINHELYLPEELTEFYQNPKKREFLIRGRDIGVRVDHVDDEKILK